MDRDRAKAERAERRSRDPLAGGSDIRILDIATTGGGQYVTFRVELANYGIRQDRCHISARVGDEPVDVHPHVLDLLPNAPPERVTVSVPRPRLGDLMKECNNETTLYGAVLTVEAGGGNRLARETWREPLYDAETDRARYDAQRRAWRRGLGEATPADRRAELSWESDQKAYADDDEAD